VLEADTETEKTDVAEPQLKEEEDDV